MTPSQLEAGPSCTEVLAMLGAESSRWRAPGAVRPAVLAEIDAIVSDRTRRHDKHEAMRLVGAAGVPAGAVPDTGELLGEPSFETRGIVQTMQHPRGTLKMPTSPVRFDGLRRASRRHRCRASTTLSCSATGSA